MSYSSSLFVFFVGLTVMGQVLLPIRFRLLWPTLMSFLWFFSWDPYLPVFLFGLISLNHFLTKKKALVLLVLTNLSALIFLRMTSFLPSLGSSFYLLILTGIGLESGKVSRTFSETFFLGSFFPVMMAGPVLRDLESPVVSKERIFDGILIFAMGFLKYQFLVVPMGFMNFLDNSVLFQVFLITMKIYLSLSSFSDMGRGVARMLGFDVVAAFHPVFFSRNPSDFWNRWNHTVAAWFRDFLIFPSLLRWGRKIPGFVIVMAGFLTLGLWHGLELHWVFFGLFNGLMIILWNKFQRAGRLLAMVTVFGNGFIQLRGSHLPVNPDWLTGLFQKNWWREGGMSFLAAICLLLICEVLQERFRDNDFFLRTPLSLKKFFAILSVIIWMWAADIRVPLVQDFLPMYFTL